MSTWQSSPIQVDGIELQIHASDAGVTFGKMIDGIYASDLLLDPSQTLQLIEALTLGVTECLKAQGRA